MLNLRYAYLFFCVFVVSCSGTRYTLNPTVETGISKELASYRKSVLSNINYTLAFNIPREKSKTITATEKLTFRLTAKVPLQLDFREDSQRLKELRVNGKVAVIDHQDEHLLIKPEYLRQGSNTIEINFDAGDGALNRNEEYLYTLFVPDRARTVFPCFDQPDLKATYTLTLTLPSDWKALANANLRDSLLASDFKTYHFEPSDLMSTYLFAFAAGKFQHVEGKTGAMTADFLYRESDTAKTSKSIPEVFKIHNDALSYLEGWTGIHYPFQKFGFVAIPDFQFGGMEHPGAIQYKSSALFLDRGATKDQINARNNLIAHETAHIWFGDLVTMNWFTDVWMKEVFANFMADKSTIAETGQEVFNLKFLVDHFPAAYSIDRTEGANPIRQKLDNLKDAGTMYGNIIYHKAPIMMRQLERLMGPDKFQEGVREYLRKFSNGNASWPDLIKILDKHAKADLIAWDKVWVNEPGRPVVDYQIVQVGDKIDKFIISQRPEYGAKRIWPQLVELKFFYRNTTQQFTVNLNEESLELTEVAGMNIPDLVLFNSSGQGYGVWPIDTALTDKLVNLENSLERASAYISLYENMLIGRSIKPQALLDLLLSCVDKEGDELNLKLITSYIGNIYWEFLSPKVREKLATTLETSLWNGILNHKQSNHKKLIFKTYQDVFTTNSGRNNLYRVWNSQKMPEGLKLTEDDFISMAFALALRDDADTTILMTQLAKITNVDRRTRFEYIMPAVSSEVSVRDAFFYRLEKKENRAREANVATALHYLHHPLRQSTSIRYLAKSLDMLEEIQTTGDIFFPQNWLQSTFGYYQSKEASVIVKNFLRDNPNFNPKLKAKVLQTVDNLLKAQKIVEY